MRQNQLLTILHATLFPALLLIACQTGRVGPVGECGDTVLDVGEACDDGSENSDESPDACRTNCILPSCGDSVVDTGEQCDEGADNSDSVADRCRTACRLPSCGDGVTDDGEECDDGQDNNDVLPNACRSECRFSHCGDGLVEAGEECDDGNELGGDGCSSICSVEPGWECVGEPSQCTCATFFSSNECRTCLVLVDGDPGISVRDGTTWGTALSSVQEGIDAVAATGADCEVWVAGGTYHVYRTSPDDSIRLQPGVHVFGGFAGIEDARSDRDWVANQTVLDGSDAGGTNRVYHVVIGANDSTLDGFTVTGGVADGPWEDRKGGGMYNFATSPTVRNCVFTGNTAVAGGAGVHNAGGAAPVFINCAFVGNFGVGMRNQQAPAIIQGCTFEENERSGLFNHESNAIVTSSAFIRNQSFGLYNDRSSSPEITDSVFLENEGTALVNSDSAPNVTQCVFEANVGGAIYNGGLSSTPVIADCVFLAHQGSAETVINHSRSAPTLMTSIFTNNGASSLWSGGAILTSQASATIIACEFSANIASRGGAIYIAGDVTVTDSQFEDNVARWGGAVYFHAGSLTITNSVIVRNTTSHFEGGAIWAASLHPTVITNCTIADNSATTFAGAIYGSNLTQVVNSILWGNSALTDPVFAYAWAPIEVSFSNVQGGYAGTGNIDADPLFVDPALDDYRLTSASPCIDVADDSNAPQSDISGSPRVDVPGFGSPGVSADLGAHEYQP